MKEKIFDYIESLKSDLINMADFMFDNPELGLEEYKASELLVEYLRKNDFSVETGLAGMDTAFRAVFENGKNGPSIGLLCEYDALERLGHACGHHLQGPCILGAAVAIKNILKDEPYKLVVYGTPAEETVSGKIKMLRKGFFKDIDIALMMHAGPSTTTDVKSLAMSNFIVNFEGVSAHAALKPEAGRSAFDALLLSFQGVEFMREHVKDDVRMHYTVLDAGGPPNVVPGNAIGKFSLRSYNRVYLDEVIKRFRNVIAGAALMTETKYDIKVDKELDSKIPVIKLNDILMENAKLLEAPSIKPPREKTGSTDFGNVMFKLPGSCIRVAFVEEGASSHSQQYLDAGKSEEAKRALIVGSKILAASVCDLVTDKELFKDVINEFNETKKKLSLV